MANNVTVFVTPVLLSLMSVYVYHVYPVPRSPRSLDISWEVGTGSLGSSALPITANCFISRKGAAAVFMWLSVDNNVYKLIFFIVHTWALLAFVVLFN